MQEATFNFRVIEANWLEEDEVLVVPAARRQELEGMVEHPLPGGLLMLAHRSAILKLRAAGALEKEVS